MCGIAGYVGLDSSAGTPILQRMAAVQAHRGPDGEGVFTHDRLGLAHRRLAIIDREGGEQPMRSADRRYVLCYNGELYNFRELRDELAALGQTFHTHSDTEVVLAAWSAWGEAALDRFVGMFALAVADTTTGTITLARDQFGIKPLYLASGDGVTVFASELRPIIATGFIPREPDDATIYRYLRFRVHDDTARTFFAGITRLLPGELATIAADGTVARRTYTSLFTDLRTLVDDPRPYDEAARDAFAGTLREAIRARLVSDVPVGTALSGGLDSSTVVATINALLAEHDAETSAIGREQNSFSAVFPGEVNDEERYVDAVAERCTNLHVHKVVPSPDQFLLDLTDFVRTQEEPVISTGPYAQYCVMREASAHVTVMIDGQGADEMMAGYVPYYLVYLRELRRRRAFGRLAVEVVRSSDVIWRLIRFRVADMFRGRRDVSITTLLRDAFVAAHREERFPVIADDLKKRLEDDLFRHSLPSLLRYEDRNTMRFSLEGRVPFLDPVLLRLLWSLEPEAILHAGWNKRALRDATASLLPTRIVRRRNKIGFTTPETAWFARIKNSIYDIFSSPSFGARPYIDQDAVLRAYRDYVAGKNGASTLMFWRLLNLELWFREFIDVDPTAGDSVTADNAVAGDAPALVTDGRHAEAPPKSDYVPNEEKSLECNGWVRFPLRVDLVAKGDDIPALASARVAEFATGLVAEAAAVRAQATGGWLLFVSEKIVAIAQGRSFFTWEVHPGWWAKRLSTRVVRTPYGIGLGHPVTMQLAIDEIGLPKVLYASVASVLGKLVGKRGVFYNIAGPQVRAIDGPTEYSAYPANVSAKLAPADPSGVARAVSAAVRAQLPVDLAATFGGTVIIDANDIGQNILGHDTDRSDPDLVRVFADNPLGQGRQQTPFAVAFEQTAPSG